MEYTTNYNLILQGRKPERVSLDSLNGNFTKIDMLLKEQSKDHNNHTEDTAIHITAEEREKWDGASELAGAVEERLKDAEERLATAETVISIIALKTNTDLNTCITAGHYASTGTTIGNTITNRPTGAVMFNLEILVCGNYITQIIYPITASYVGRIYIRRGWDNGASWGDWYEFSGVAMTTTTEV